MYEILRTLPENAKAVLEQSRLSIPPIERELVRRGNLNVDERYRTLNMGIGYTLVVPIEVRSSLGGSKRAAAPNRRWSCIPLAATSSKGE